MSPRERATRIAHELSGVDMGLDAYRALAADPGRIGRGFATMIDVIERHLLADRGEVAAGRDAIEAAVRVTGCTLQRGGES